MVEFTIMARRRLGLKQRPPRLSLINRKCVSAACSIHDFIDKNCNIFVLKVKKLDEEVTDIGREFQILGPW